MFEKTKINEKEAGVGPFFKKNENISDRRIVHINEIFGDLKYS